MDKDTKFLKAYNDFGVCIESAKPKRLCQNSKSKILSVFTSFRHLILGSKILMSKIGIRKNRVFLGPQKEFWFRKDFVSEKVFCPRPF